MVEKSRTVTVDDIRSTCIDHVEKQLRGQFGVTLKSSGNDQLGKILKAKLGYHPQSPEAHRAAAQLDSIVKQQSRQMPHKRHDLRQKSLYVEPSDSGTSWNRPKDQSKQTARDEIVDAANAYAGALDRFTCVDIYRDEDPAFYSALEAWKECPTMPAAPHPPAFD